MSGSTIYYLEMTSEQKQPSLTKPKSLKLMEVEHRQWQFNRFLYQLVGQAWQWKDKLNLSEHNWKEYACNPCLHTWVAYFDGAIAGYFELQQQDKGHVEICYFGLSEDFIGKGLGSVLLSAALQQAWALNGTKRVWLHTCSEDHPNALQNYLNSGFSVFDKHSS